MKLHSLLLIMLGLFISSIVSAQYDDLYFDPNTDIVMGTEDSDSYDDYNDYDDESYAGQDDVDFYYTSRIRRFNRSYNQLGYFSPSFTNVYFYDRFDTYDPFNTVFVVDQFGYVRPINVFNSPYYTSPNGGSVFVGYGSGINSGYVFNPAFGGGGVAGCPPYGGSNIYENTATTVSNNTGAYTGSRDRDNSQPTGGSNYSNNAAKTQDGKVGRNGRGASSTNSDSSPARTNRTSRGSYKPSKSTKPSRSTRTNRSSRSSKPSTFNRGSNKSNSPSFNRSSRSSSGSSGSFRNSGSSRSSSGGSSSRSSRRGGN